ncbi:MAG: FCD domain-containing protein, partial [Caulobacterales bacterium]
DESGSFALPSCSHEHVREILLIRRELESMAAAHAAKRATRPFISELESLRDLQRNAENYRTWTAANHAFHFQIYEAANMPALVDIIDELWRETGPYLIEAMDAACASNSLLRQEQDKIISALHTKNARAARAAMADELDGLSAFILSNLRTEPLHRAAG